MEPRTFFLVTVGFLGFLSAILGFIAENKKIVESDVTRLTSTECLHGRSPSMVLGLVAAFSLLIVQIISNALGGCICCESGPHIAPRTSSRAILAVAFLTLSWVTFSIAFLLLLAGASINDRRDASADSLSTGCYILKSGVFTGAAFAALTTAALGIAYNLQVMSVRKAPPSLLGSIGANTSEENVNSNNVPLSQEYPIGKPLFSAGQQVERSSSFNTGSQNQKRAVYSRTVVNNDTDIRHLQMVDINNPADSSFDAQSVKGTRGSTTSSTKNLTRSQLQSKAIAEKMHLPQNTRQSASAEYMPAMVKTTAPLTSVPNTIAAHAESPQPGPQPRQGVGRVWEQSKYYKTP